MLPRPPSSPNDIDRSFNIRSSKLPDQKLYNEKKSPLFYQQSRPMINRFTNVQEKPNTDNYKLLEIELREGLNDKDRIGKSAIRFGEIIREVLRGDDELSVKKISSVKKLNGMNKEKLYYLKKGKLIPSSTSWEPRSYLKSINSYDPNVEKRYVTKSFYRPKKYRGDVDNYRPSKYAGKVITEEGAGESDENRNNTYDFVSDSYKNGYESTDEVNTTENYLPPTSSELPKQIPPPPPGKIPSQTVFPHTTPVIRSMSRRTDILPHGLTI